MYFKPFSSQLYRLSQIAVTMAVDLDLSHSLSLYQTDDSDFQSPTASKRNTARGYHDEIERARTFIGTYCMSASVAMAHRKPTHLKFDDQIDQISQILANSKEVPSDAHLLLHHVRVRKLTEDIYRIFNINNLNDNTVMDERYIDTMVMDFERQYAYIRDSMSSEAWDNGAFLPPFFLNTLSKTIGPASLKCAVTYLPVVIYEVGLRMPPSHRSMVQSSSSTPCCSWCMSSTRLAIVMKGIHAAQNFITTFLDLPNPVFRHSTIVEVSRHIDAVFLLARASLGLDTMSLQMGKMATGRVDLLATADLERYLEASERKMASMVAFKTPENGGVDAEKGQDAFWKLQEIFRFCLMWYRMNVSEKQGNSGLVGQVDPTEISRLQMPSMFLLSKGSNLPDLRGKATNRPPTYDQAEDFGNDATPKDGLHSDVEGMLMELNVCEKSMALMSVSCPGLESGATTGDTSQSDSPSLSELATGSGTGTGTDSVGTEPEPELALNDEFNLVPDVGFESTSDIDPWSSMMQASPTLSWFTL